MMTKLPRPECPISTARMAVYLANGTFKDEIKCCHGARAQFLRSCCDGCYGGNKILAVLGRRPIKFALAFYAPTRAIAHSLYARLSDARHRGLISINAGLERRRGVSRQVRRIFAKENRENFSPREKFTYWYSSPISGSDEF